MQKQLRSLNCRNRKTKKIFQSQRHYKSWMPTVVPFSRNERNNWIQFSCIVVYQRGCDSGLSYVKETDEKIQWLETIVQSIGLGCSLVSKPQYETEYDDSYLVLLFDSTVLKYVMDRNISPFIFQNFSTIGQQHYGAKLCRSTIIGMTYIISLK